MQRPESLRGAWSHWPMATPTDPPTKKLPFFALQTPTNFDSFMLRQNMGLEKILIGLNRTFH